MAVAREAPRTFYQENRWVRAWEAVAEHDDLRNALLLLPAVLCLVLLFLLPIAGVLKLSLFDPGPTLRHYAQLVSVSAYLKVLGITFKTAALVTLLSLLLGYPVAYLMATVRPGVTNLLVILVLVPFWISVLVRTYAWMVILGRQGLLNTLLLGLGLIEAPLRLMHNFVGLVVGMTHVLLPFMILPMFSVMKNIDRDLLKAAENLGANRWHAFRRVFLPLSLPGVAGGCALVFVLGLGFFITPALLGGPRDLMISMLIERQVNDLTNWGFGSALAVMLLAVTGLALFLFKRFLGVGAWRTSVEMK